MHFTALVTYGHPYGASCFSLQCFECCILLNKNLILQSVEQCLIVSSVWMDVPWANVFCPSVDVLIICHAKHTQSLVPFYQVKAIQKVVCCSFEKIGNHLICVLSLNLHTCLVAKVNSVLSLFSYCKCYLFAYINIFGGGRGVGAVSHSRLWIRSLHWALARSSFLFGTPEY